MHVKKSKELDVNSPTKNDLKDALVIAKLVKDGLYSVPQIPQGIVVFDNCPFLGGVTTGTLLIRMVMSIDGTQAPGNQ